jgi:AraC family transcriptional regulator
MKTIAALENQTGSIAPAFAERNVPRDESSEEIQRFISRARFTVRHTATEACAFEPHAHAAYTITTLLAGKLIATVGDDTFELSAGQTTLTNVGQNHSARGEQVEFLSIAISAALINEMVTEIGLTRTAAQISFQQSTVTDAAVTKMAREIAIEVADVQMGRAAMLDAQVRQLAIHLLRCHLTVRQSDQIELSRAGPVDRRLRRAIEFMHDNFSRELALEEIASAAYLSEYHFARLFKQITGVTPHVYLANVRLERARRLLADTALPISEVASMVGYQSQSHFSKMFRSVTGITPKAYREATKP